MPRPREPVLGLLGLRWSGAGPSTDGETKSRNRFTVNGYHERIRAFALKNEVVESERPNQAKVGRIGRLPARRRQLDVVCEWFG